MNRIDRGIAFIFEGQTESVFYYSILEHYLSKHNEYKIFKEQVGDLIEYQFVLSNGIESVVIKTYTVGTIIAHTQASAIWFRSNCHQRYKQIEWTVFLCYDTDSHNRDVSQFQEGDWKELKKTLKRNARTSIIDLAASADIEDIMLIDLDGVCGFLGIPKCSLPSGRKGKSKMKRLFRINGSCYHEGERAKSLIDYLNKDVIIKESTIPFKKIEEVCFK
jgi:hypothetical protein